MRTINMNKIKFWTDVRCVVPSCAKCIRINFENKIWKSNNKAQKHEKHWTLHFINRKQRRRRRRLYVRKFIKFSCWRTFFCASIFSFFLSLLLREFFSLCYLEYIILNWRLLLFLSKLVMMLILVLAVLFLLIDPLYMNLSSKHSIKKYEA